jgi:hypothetical protein
VRSVMILMLAACTKTAADTDTDVDTDTIDTDEPVEAGTETATMSWDVDMFTLYESPTIARFDTMGGRRKLDGLTIVVDHEADMTVAVENGGAEALAAEDYAFRFDFLTITQLGTVDADDGEGEGPPFFGPGMFESEVSVPLEPGDGDPETLEDAHVESASQQLHFEAHYDGVETPEYLDALTGTEPLTVVVGGFSESWVEWIDDHGGEAFLYGGNTALRYRGTLTVTYAYSPT